MPEACERRSVGYATTWDTRMQQTTIKIKGLDCASCAEKIEKTLLREKGIESVSVHIGSEKVEVAFDSSSISQKRIERSIEALGYEVVRNGSPAGPDISAFWRMGFVLFLIVLSFTGLGSRIVSFDIFSIAAIILGAYPLFRHAARDILNKNITAEVFMALGVATATAIGEFRSAAIIAFFMLISEYIDSFTMEKSRRAIKELIDLAPKTARVRRGDDEIEVPVEEVKMGEIVVVRPGEKVPVEGVVISGRGAVSEAPITGESFPVEKKEGDAVYAATINQMGLLFVRVLHTGKDTTYARIIRLVEEAEAAKAPVQKVADKFATYFTPAIILIAAATYVITGEIRNAIAVMVVACPCSGAIATPLAVVASMGTAARKGIIIKGGRYLEALAKVDTLVVDKTGTLTLGNPVVTDIKGFGITSKEEVLALAASIEKYSEHPLAGAILKEASSTAMKVPEPDESRVLTGMGVVASVNKQMTALGNRELMAQRGIEISDEVETYCRRREDEGKTALMLADAEKITGVICVADIIREGTIEAMDSLRELGFREPVMLTGDNPRTAGIVASHLGITKVMAGLLPQDKVEKIRQLVSEGKRVVMVGDGINDAPALALSHVGVSMGAAGSDVAIEASDVALMRDEWKQVPQAIEIGRNTFTVIRQNLALGIVFNLVGIGLASTGVLSPTTAAVAHIMPDVLVFMNSSRLLKR